MGHFSEQYITNCDLRTSDDAYLDRRDGVSSAPSIFTSSTTPQFTSLDQAQAAAAGRARTTMQTWHVIETPRGYQIADDADVGCYGYRSLCAIEPEDVIDLDPPSNYGAYWLTCGLPNPLYRVQQAELNAMLDPPGPNPEDDSEGDECDDEWRASTCANCCGAHSTQQCPQIRAALFAEDALRIAA